MSGIEGHLLPFGYEKWDLDMQETYHRMYDGWQDVLCGGPTDVAELLADYTEEHGLSKDEAAMLGYKSLCGVLGIKIGDDARKPRSGA